MCWGDSGDDRVGGREGRGESAADIQVWKETKLNEVRCGKRQCCLWRDEGEMDGWVDEWNVVFTVQKSVGKSVRCEKKRLSER